MGLLRFSILGIRVFEFTPYVDERFDAAHAILGDLDVDVLAIQEVYDWRRRVFLIEKLHKRFPYQYQSNSANLSLGLDDGLMILSVWPIEVGEFARFKIGTWDEQLFVRKGFQSVQINHPSFGKFQLVNIHTTAGGAFQDPESAAVDELRAKQIDQILCAVPANKRVFLVGDLNAGPKVSQGNYEQILEAGFADGAVKASGEDVDWVTWDNENPLNKQSPHSDSPGQRIDHVFLNQNAQEAFKPVSAEIALTDPIVAVADGRLISVSDHYAVRVKFKPV